MARKVREWVGNTPDSPVPKHVYLRQFKRQEGRCPNCTQKMRGKPIIEHVQPLSMGGENREGNIELWCKACATVKTSKEAAPRAKADRVLTKHIGIKRRKGPPMPGSRASKWKKKLDGTVVLREDE